MISSEAGASGGFFLFGVLHFLDRHVAEFVGVEDLSAIEALDEFNIIFACHNPDPWVFADRIHGQFGRQSQLVMGQIVSSPERLSTGFFDGL